MNATTRILATLCASILWCASLAQSLEVIALKHRTAEDVIPVLEPLLEAGGALSGEHYTLFVRASPANLRQLRAALEQIDREPRQLIVSVRRMSAADAQADQTRVRLRTDRDHSTRTGVAVRAAQGEERARANSISSVRVLEGNSAFIATGTTVPLVTAVAAGIGRHRWGAVNTEYRELQSGFLVSPRITRDGVVIEIEQRVEELRNGVIERNSLSTQVAARMGEWVELSGVDESRVSSSRGVATREYRTRSDAQSVWIKIDAQ